MNEWIGKKCKIFIRNLSTTGAIVYTATVISYDGQFITFIDRENKKITVNRLDIIQIRGADE